MDQFLVAEVDQFLVAATRESESGEVSPLPRDVQNRIDAEHDPANRIVVAETIDTLHPLVQKAAAKLRRAELDYEGFLRSGGDTLDIKVSQASLDRALRIVDALVSALSARKLQVEVVGRSSAGYPSSVKTGTRVLVLDEWLTFRLYERYSMNERPKKSKATEPTWLSARTQKVPNGRFVLEVTSRSDLGHSLSVETQWSEDRKPVDGRLNDFVAGLFVIAEELKRERARVADIRRAEAEVEKERRRVQELAAQQRERDEQISELVTRWRVVEDVRQYVDEIRALATANSHDLSDGSLLDQHIASALDYANRNDPLRQLRAAGSPPSKPREQTKEAPTELTERATNRNVPKAPNDDAAGKSSPNAAQQDSRGNGKSANAKASSTVRLSMQIDMPFAPEDEETRAALRPCSNQHSPNVKCHGFIARPEQDGVATIVHYVEDPPRRQRLLDLLLGILDNVGTAPGGDR